MGHGSKPPLAELYKKPDGSIFLTAVRDHFLKSKQPSATTIYSADAEMAAVVTGPEAPSETGLNGGGDGSARPKGGFVFAPAPLDPSATFHKQMEVDGTTLYAIAQIIPRFTGGHTTGLGLYPAVEPGNKFAPLNEPTLLMKYDHHKMCHTIVNVNGEGVGFSDPKRKSVTIASGVDAVLVLALISEFDYYTRVGSYGNPAE